MSHNASWLVVPMIIICSLMGCGSTSHHAGGSHLSSVFSDTSWKFLSRELIAKDKWAQSVGSVMAALPDPVTVGSSFFVPICGGILVSPKHVLTAAHCVRDGLFFTFSRIAESTDLDQWQWMVFGNSIRLNFSGRLIELADSPLHRFAMGRPVFVDQKNDFAIFLSEEIRGDYEQKIIHLHPFLRDPEAKTPTRLFTKLALYGFPTGAPITRSADCGGETGSLPDNPNPVLFHDCASLNGSSGGLLMDEHSNSPIAMHTRGPGLNDAEFWKVHGRFETPREIAVRNGCPGGDAIDQDCERRRGMNRAIPLRTAAMLIASDAPQLWLELGGK